MARRCHCDRLLQFWQTDPRFVLVGKATSAVWLELVLMMHRLGDPEGFRFGFQIGSLKELAMVVRLGEAELETHLEPILARGLLRREPDGALLLPVELAPSAKAKAARNNGLKGGRPRKDGAPPGQRSMMLPLPGGGDTTPSENPTETQGGSRLDRVYDSEESSSQTAGGEAGVLGSKIAALVGVEAGRTASSHVARWLAQGATPELVLDTVHLVLERVPSGTKIGSLRYFEAAIEHALAARIGRNGGFAQGGRTAAKPEASGETRVSPMAQAARPTWEVQARQRWADDTIAFGRHWNLHPSPPPPPDLEAYLSRARAEASEGAGADVEGGVGQAA